MKHSIDTTCIYNVMLQMPYNNQQTRSLADAETAQHARRSLLLPKCKSSH